MISSMIVRRSGEGPSHNILGMRNEYKLLASESGGRILSFVMTVPPGRGAPMHFHDVDCESFYILEGEITVVNPDGSRNVAAEGDFVWFDSGHSHAFINEGTTNARALIVQSPGIEAQTFFSELSAAEQDEGFAPGRDVPAIGSRHGVRIAEPA
jgi:quercetin dioxygenase-like cupin family protein